MAERRLKFWGWGHVGDGPDEEQKKKIGDGFAQRFGVDAFEATPDPRIEEIALRSPRVKPPKSLQGITTDEPWERARHALGRAFRDVVRAYRRDFSSAPDQVAFPTTEAEVMALLDWCTDARIACIPFGGGSSVVGGVECREADAYSGVVSIDMGRMDRVVEIDRASRTAQIQAGVMGPALEDQLRPHGLTLRHFPQSFEFSSLGGWIATRSGGHFATLYTHIDDFVESLRVVTPNGVVASRRVPGSGAGPSPDRFFIGSEGTLGIITEAWMRLQDRPTHRANASVFFQSFEEGVAASKALSQSGLYPSNCRLLDAAEAASSGASAGGEALLVLAFESADHAPDTWMKRSLELCRDHGGRVPEGQGATRSDAAGGREGAAGAWRNAFLQAPFARDALCALGVISDTFETAITWDRFEGFHASMMRVAQQALDDVCGRGTVTCRFTHLYPDGPAPYFTLMGPGRKGHEIEQWDEIKARVSEALITEGGTITHHHSVGRDHRPWYDRQRPDAYAEALVAAKRSLDPAGILNPGVLIDPHSG